MPSGAGTVQDGAAAGSRRLSWRDHKEDGPLDRAALLPPARRKTGPRSHKEGDADSGGEGGDGGEEQPETEGSGGGGGGASAEASAEAARALRQAERRAEASEMEAEALAAAAGKTAQRAAELEAEAAQQREALHGARADSRLLEAQLDEYREQLAAMQRRAEEASRAALERELGQQAQL